MAIYNREDYGTALPQLEKRVKTLEDIVEVPLRYDRCAPQSAAICYRIGRIVYLSFHIQVTTSTAAYAYVTGLPEPIHRWNFSSEGTNGGARWVIENNKVGSLSGYAPSLGYHSGFVAYITKE